MVLVFLGTELSYLGLKGRLVLVMELEGLGVFSSILS